MYKVQLHAPDGAKRRKKFALPEALFDGTVNEAVLHRAVTIHLGNQRQGTASTKTRAEVSGGRSKPWRQKGTGRARQGTTRAAQWRGGGVVFGPKPRSYRRDLPAKVRRLARKSALNARAREEALHVVEQLQFEAPKTKAMVALLEKLGVAEHRVLILTAGLNREAYLSARNLQRVEVMRYEDATAYDILRATRLVIEQAAFGEPGPDAVDTDADGEASDA